MEEFPDSKVHLSTTRNWTYILWIPSRRPGSLVLGQSGRGGGGAGRKWVWPKGVRGGERFLKNNISSTYSTNQIPSDTLNCIFPGGTCLRGKYCFFHSSQPAKFCLKNGYFKEQIHWVPLYLLCLFPVFSHSGHLTSSAFLDVQLLYSLCYYMTNFCSLIGLEQWYFSLIWNTYMWKLQTFCS